MITQDNLTQVLQQLNFINTDNVFTKKINKVSLTVDFNQQKIIYPTAITINDKTTCNFSANENFVVFECVHRLLEQGYQANHIELEKKWQLGHSQKSGKADICVKDNDDNIILIIECKTAGSEYSKAKNILENDPRNQLFSYFQQTSTIQFLALYASDFDSNKLVCNYYLINVQDNNELLANNKKLIAYRDSNTTEEKWQVWCDTYDQEYATLGLFENNRPYEIGKTSFNIDDLKIISNKDIQGKYHEFATILRQYNVSGRENAFDKLVNLFLCKITDEKENHKKLKFYWKGKAYDNPFDFQDRLQELYQIGMEKFLNDKITYIANHQIDEAFGVFKDKPNTTKETIKEYFKELKFFSNNDFAFIDVHNEKLFYQNFAVLLKVAQMIQDIRLTGSEENQFLGDMFEGFLDAGVKQSEGQFFTPMPIVKFIINSLADKEQPKVIDYACGAGHFLNEYFSKNSDSDIIGIEKEYRLSKVAKVSSFMYGSDDSIKIIYNDALADNEDVKNNSFDVLIANPPYSVKGFLTTLSEDDREQFELSALVNDISKTNAIECFFIEKAKQLLKKDGIAGIIVPSSILNKDTPSLYSKTREILLQHFYIVAIAEFGSGTFGKTGTNTVTLFLQRRDPSQKLDKHYKNMVNEWFAGDLDINKVFKDEHFLDAYCQYMQFNAKDYKAFLQGQLSAELFNNELFSEYQKAFEKSYKAPKTKVFKAKSKEEKQAIKDKAFFHYLQTKESEKLYFFCLANKQANEVVIVKAPSDNNSAKKFLGYEWSNRKGDEGIKYLASVSLEIDAELESDDKRILENQQGLKYINTPLYNPSDSDDMGKINKIIKDNFNGIKTEITEELKPFVSRAKLVDMLDFDRVDFGKTLSLNPKKKIEIESKYPIVKIKDICEIGRGRVINQNEIQQNLGDYPVYSSQTSNNGIYGKINTFDFDGEYVTWTTDGIYAGTCFYRNGKFNCTNVCGTLKAKNKQINMKFLPLVLNNETDKYVTKSANPKLMNNQMAEIKIPLPPLETQQKIVDEMEILKEKSKQNNQKIKSLQEEISQKINIINAKKVKLDSEIISINSESFNPKTKANENFIYVDIDSISKGTGEIDYSNIIKGKNAPSRARRIVKNDSVIISTVRPYLKGFAYVEQEKENCIFSTGFAVLKGQGNILSKYLYLLFMFSNDLMKQMEEAMPKSAYPSINKSDIENFTIPLPPIAEQQKIVAEIEKIETQIKTLEEKLQKIPTQKEQILKEYL